LPPRRAPLVRVPVHFVRLPDELISN